MTNQEEDYLEKDFDYTKLTIPKIKKILLDNGVTDFPQKAKKTQLLEIYKENIFDKLDVLKKKKKQEENKGRNVFQGNRSSIIELEANENDQKGGEFTSGRQRRRSSGLPEIEVPVEERLKVIKNGALRRGSLNTEEPKEKITRPKTASPIKNQNTSFLASIGDHLKSTSNRRKPQEEKPIEKQTPIKKEEGNRKKIVVDIDSSDFSNTSFFSYQTNKGSSPRKEKIVVPPPQKATSRFLLPVTVLFVLVSYFVLKNLPYCENDGFFCCLIPKNGRLVNGRLVCEDGFILKKSFFKDLCVKDDTKEVQMLKTIRSIIKKLEIQRGNYHYGLSKDFKMNLSQLTTNNDLIQILKHTPGIVIADGFIYSTNYRTTLRVFFKHYSTKALYFLVPLLILFIVSHFFQRYRLAVNERKAASKKIVKEILNILLRQLIISSKNSKFPGYVYVDQLKDVFVVEKNVWEMVRKKVEANSNVRRDEIDNKVIWEWVGPLIQSTENIETLVV